MNKKGIVQMKNLEKLVEECKKELDEIGVPYQTVQNWSVNTRAKSKWGQCKKVSTGVFDINISQCLLQDEVSDTAVKNTIIHELLHTVEGCYDHKRKWKLFAEKVNRAYPQYNIKRTTTSDEKGIEGLKRTYQKNYKIICNNCGRYWYRQKASKLIQHPEKYRCAKCGGKLNVKKERTLL